MKKQIAVMVSGGIDSYLAYLYAKTMGKNADVYPMFVNLQQPYHKKEFEASYKLFGEELIVIRADLCNEELDNVPTLTRQEIYGRNLLLAFYGANLGEEVWLAALQTEMNPLAVRDKHPEFFHLSSALLTYVFKSKRFETKVFTPFSQWTKSDIIAMGLNMWGATEEALKETVSCYHEDHKNCGMCSTCFKRWIAMSNNGIEEEYVVHPFVENPYARKVVELMIEEVNTNTYSGRFSLQRYNETQGALRKAKLLDMPERSIW